MSTQTQSKNVTLTTLKKIKEAGQKFACLTAYDACFAEIASSAGVDVLLVGDSLGMVSRATTALTSHNGGYGVSRGMREAWQQRRANHG